MKIKEKEFENILQDLKQIALQMGAKVRFERGDFKGGYCIMKEDKIIVINKLSPLQKKVLILSNALKELGVDEVYLTPRMREIIEQLSDNT
ncbi:hypothetical protein MROS_2510 [Melioribacter roseus P3M-2]|jgi:hypothetical protein|uniref:Uncharacterized protein n=1 Tax=Melioribacter roseus (strain DSM 23840 / JCM 17771 / VKM B-2668 / P3M-2) TaxID=1191523 RepID=I6Z9C4_MELRP|nr:hypothetical protein [Melioribacter roseus]AFN75740.1 hypothetical protein MROS_2510 [Melioribacter roseus P3M-2]